MFDEVNVMKRRRFFTKQVLGLRVFLTNTKRPEAKTVEFKGGEDMKSKIILGVATLLGLALPSFAQQTYCRPDRDGDRRVCTTQGYDGYGNYYRRSYSQPMYGGYYNGYNGGYNGYYGNGYYRGYDDHARHEWREHMEHERHEWREHHDGDWR